MRGALGNDDDGVQLHAVAHRDHHDALDVVGRGSGRVEVRRDVGRQRRRLRKPARSDRGECEECENGWPEERSHGGILSPLAALIEAMRL